MNTLYPEIEPYARGMLDVGEGNQIYWETCGNPDGKPVVVLHGGPGSGCRPGTRRYFDPALYCIVLFDQRGCGQSIPHASDPTTDLSVNTTWHLLADIERLREHLNLERWMVFGGSWGSTLALTYAEQYPERVTEIVLFGVAMTRHSEIDWLFRGVAPLFPEAWACFRAGVPEAEQDTDILEAYYKRLHHTDPEVRLKAARDFHEWDWAPMSVISGAPPSKQWLDPHFQLARARICTHYFKSGAWLEDGILLRQAHRLMGIPGVMVHGRLDVGSPLLAAWELAQVWTDGELRIVGGAGHLPSDPGMEEALIRATDRFAGRP